ncbi:MAG: type II/IV secretion system protein, partial [Candidatus Magasanikbacteria bacterium]|nr:type II/IV secretion system protein [Candidatus Magasanikbacteria bacterium]
MGLDLGAGGSLNIAGGGLEEKLKAKLQTVGLKQREQATASTAAQSGFPYIDLTHFPITQEALMVVPEEQAKTLKAFCFFNAGEDLRIAAINPADKAVADLMHQLEERLHAKGSLYQISEESFRVALERYATLPKVLAFKDEVSLSEEALKNFRAITKDKAQLQKLLAEATITDVVAIVTAAALEMKSSDIHVEAEEKGIAVRFRVDGILQDVAMIPKERWKQMIARFKLVASLKINVDSVPQDGRFTIVEDGKKIDVRISTLPTVYGESVVMRILKPLSNVEFESLGIRGTSFEQLKEQIARPNGMVITVGPTGSGKTTTLYSILYKLNKPGVKIITLEDPVEYKMEGINQSQIDPSKDYTFAKGLKSLLRQDPDICMVGEIRDLETAEIAIQAALTGHLMISTIHTNSAAGAIPRFLAMGVKPFLLAPALNAVIGQRLLRKLCEKCKKPLTLDEAQTKKVQEMMATLSPTAGVTFDVAKATWFGPVG